MTARTPSNPGRTAAKGILVATALVGIAVPVYALLDRTPQPVAVPVQPSAKKVAQPPLASLIRVGAAAVTPTQSATPVPSPTPTQTPTPAAATANVGPPVLVVRRILDTGGPIPYGKFFWNEADVPAGPLVITVDLAAETISAFRDGYEIGTAAIIFGDRGKETPLGVFPITQKDADHVSNLYDAPMPYMLRLTNDGISIHASKVSWEYATHGCIGVPLGFAKRLFAATKLGDKVIVTRGRMMGMGQRIEVPAA